MRSILSINSGLEWDFTDFFDFFEVEYALEEVAVVDAAVERLVFDLLTFLLFLLACLRSTFEAFGED